MVQETEMWIQNALNACNRRGGEYCNNDYHLHGNPRNTADVDLQSQISHLQAELAHMQGVAATNAVQLEQLVEVFNNFVTAYSIREGLTETHD